MMPSALERFRTSVEGFDAVWIDGYDLDALTELDGGPREEAMEMIRQAVAREDLRAARALADLADPALAGILREAFPDSRGVMRVEIAVALSRLTGDAGLEAELLSVLGSGEGDERFAAAFALRFFPVPGVKEALFDAVCRERNEEVRTAAAISLMLLSGMMQSVLDFSRRDIVLGLDSKDPGVRGEAVEALRMAVRESVTPRSSPEAPPAPRAWEEAPPPAEKVCTSCGGPVSPGASFCRGCGAPVAGG